METPAYENLSSRARLKGEPMVTLAVFRDCHAAIHSTGSFGYLIVRGWYLHIYMLAICMQGIIIFHLCTSEIWLRGIILNKIV